MKKTYSAVLAAGLTICGALSTQFCCAGTDAAGKPAMPAKTSPQSVPENSALPNKTEKPPVSGKVLETMSAAGYTYILLEKNDKTGWVAVPSAKVVVGQEVQVKPGLEMGLFESKSLKRSFDNIIFSPGLVPDPKDATVKIPTGAAAAQKPAGHPDAKNKAKPKGMAAMFGSGGGESGTLSGKVVETRDAGGYTYINLEKDGKQTWAAVPVMKVTVGEQLELQPGAVMTNFTSKSMNKTFESVVFSGGPVLAK